MEGERKVGRRIRGREGERGDSGGSLLAVTCGPVICIFHSQIGCESHNESLFPLLYVHVRAGLAACEMHTYKMHVYKRCTPVRDTRL
jgi:hypothetical protein